MGDPSLTDVVEDIAELRARDDAQDARLDRLENDLRLEIARLEDKLEKWFEHGQESLLNSAPQWVVQALERKNLLVAGFASLAAAAVGGLIVVAVAVFTHL